MQAIQFDTVVCASDSFIGTTDSSGQYTPHGVPVYEQFWMGDGVCTADKHTGAFMLEFTTSKGYHFTVASNTPIHCRYEGKSYTLPAHEVPLGYLLEVKGHTNQWRRPMGGFNDGVEESEFSQVAGISVLDKPYSSEFILGYLFQTLKYFHFNIMGAGDATARSIRYISMERSEILVLQKMLASLGIVSATKDIHVDGTDPDTDYSQLEIHESEFNKIKSLYKDMDADIQAIVQELPHSEVKTCLWDKITKIVIAPRVVQSRLLVNSTYRLNINGVYL